LRTTKPLAAPSLAAALLGSTRSAVLSALLLHPEASAHVREIARMTGASAGSLHRELRILTELGLLKREERGLQVFYSADTTSPVYPEISAFLRKTVGLADALRSALSPLSDRIRSAFVYGSMAAGGVSPHSDVDVLVVGPVPFVDVVRALHPLQQTLGLEINPTVMTAAEFERGRRSADGFLPTVLGGQKIWLIGGDDELGKPRKNRPTQAAPAKQLRVAATPGRGAAQPGRRRTP
jgi:DNA-binding transcriptional ArsR family regulator